MSTATYDEYAQNAEQPREPDHVTRAVMLCKDPEFLHFLEARKYYVWGTLSEKDARNVLCELCGIKSRSELKDNTEAQAKFRKLDQDFRRSASGASAA